MLCREGWYFLGVLGFVVLSAMLRDINLLLALAGMMIGILLYHWRQVVVGIGPLQPRRAVPDAVQAGTPCSIVFNVHNRSARRTSQAIVVEDRIERLDDAHAPQTTRTFLPIIAPRQTERVAYQACFHDRGQYRFAGPRLGTRFPLGLISHRRQFQTDDVLTVYPSCGQLLPAWRRLRLNAHAGSRRSTRQGAAAGDFFALRDWQSGDSRRAIHWKTSARRGALVVRQFEQQQDENLLLLLDLCQPPEVKNSTDVIEQAISFVATVVAEHGQRGGGRLSLGLAVPDVRFFPSVSNTTQAAEVMEALAVATVHEHSQADLLANEAVRQARHGVQTVLVTTGGVGSAVLPPANGKSLMRIDASSDQLASYFQWERPGTLERVALDRSGRHLVFAEVFGRNTTTNDPKLL